MDYAAAIARMDANRPPAWELLNGGTISYDKESDRVVTEWTAETRHCHSVPGHPKGGIVQGGIVTGWLDAAMAAACLIRDGSTGVASLEIKVSFLRAAHPGLHRAYGKIVRQGRNIAFLEAELYDQNDTLLAQASSTALLRA